MYLCLDDFLTGRWDECEQLAEQGVEECRGQNFNFFAWYFLYNKALMAAGRGCCDEADEIADEITRWAAPRGVRGAEIFAQHPRVLAALCRGDYEGVFRHASAMSPLGTLAPYVPHALWVMFDAVEAAMRTGREEEARAHVATMRAENVGAISPRMAMIQAGAEALVAKDDARRHFEEALSVAGSERWVYDTGRIRLAYGEWLRRTKATNQARAQLQAAHDSFEEMGAEPLAARAATELRATGQGVTRAVTPTTARLTAQELEIAELAASGLTNRQIADKLYLSPRTVGSHLYRIFPKLGITSRAALRDALSSQSPDDH
jgi:DNA-binding NarL/FixJ family response regulator